MGLNLWIAPMFFPCRILRGMIQNIETDGQRNVLGSPLSPCSMDPLTGFYRNGCCNTGPEDEGSHTVCVIMSETFLAFSRSVGNDLSTPMPAYGFPGLNPGDQWCLCAPRWQEALEAGVAPPVVLEATHVGALDYISLADLEAHAVDLHGDMDATSQGH